MGREAESNSEPGPRGALHLKGLARTPKYSALEWLSGLSAPRRLLVPHTC